MWLPWCFSTLFNKYAIFLICIFDEGLWLRSHGNISIPPRTNLLSGVHKGYKSENVRQHTFISFFSAPESSMTVLKVWKPSLLICPSENLCSLLCWSNGFTAFWVLIRNKYEGRELYIFNVHSYSKSMTQKVARFGHKTSIFRNMVSNGSTCVCHSIGLWKGEATMRRKKSQWKSKKYGWELGLKLPWVHLSWSLGKKCVPFSKI